MRYVLKGKKKPVEILGEGELVTLTKYPEDAGVVLSVEQASTGYYRVTVERHGTKMTRDFKKGYKVPLVERED